MEDYLTHEIELYPPDSFQMLLDHEIARARRYQHPLSIMRISVEAKPQTPHTQHSAEVFAINALNLEVRETDIPCKMGNEFLLLMPFTSELGSKIVSERLEKVFKVEHQTYDRVSFHVSTFIGMTSAIGDSPISSKKLMEQASEALQFAKEHKLQNAVLFSEMK